MFNVSYTAIYPFVVLVTVYTLNITQYTDPKYDFRE